MLSEHVKPRLNQKAEKINENMFFHMTRDRNVLNIWYFFSRISQCAPFVWAFKVILYGSNSKGESQAFNFAPDKL